ncbi:MAG: MBL fold metallo-hydrolase [bacterium]|nr:MBL fold metallo-hydrolase [bacterium]
MNITWHGQGMIKIIGKTDLPVTIVVDPFSERETGLRPPRPEADAILISSDRPESANIDTIQGQPVIINSAGEYDVKGVTVRGIPSYHDAEQGKKYGDNTIFLIQFEGMSLCHLGCLGHALSERQIDDIGDCDVLFVPIGGDRTMDTKTAIEVINKIEPRMVVPTHYAIPKLKYKLAPVGAFLKEMGVAQAAPEPRLKLKKSDLPGEETRVVLLAKE